MRAFWHRSAVSMSPSPPIAATPPACSASRAIWRPAGWARSRPKRSSRWRANSPSPKTITLDFTPENKNACPIFAGRLIRGVKNGPAPKWVQDRLKSVGMKSISALVDATNLIAQDRGRPAACVRRRQAVRQSACPHGQGARAGPGAGRQDLCAWTTTPSSSPMTDRAGIAGIMGGMDTGSFAGNQRMSSSNPPGSIPPASRAPGASWASFPTRAIASSAASIRNSCCRAWSCAPS